MKYVEHAPEGMNPFDLNNPRPFPQPPFSGQTSEFSPSAFKALGRAKFEHVNIFLTFWTSIYCYVQQNIASGKLSKRWYYVVCLVKHFSPLKCS